MTDREPRRFRRYRYGPGASRIVIPIVAGLGGIVFSIIGILRLGAHHDSTVLVVGLVLVAVGIIGVLVGLWMGKRGM